MGASKWSYFTPFQHSEQDALDGLRERVFAEDFEDYQEAGIETLAALMASAWLEEEPAHSVLDVERVVRCEEHMEEPGDVRVVEAAEVVELFGTTRPGRDVVEQALKRAGDGWFPPFDRGSGCCTIVYDAEGHPAELCFWGFTGD
ncbi:hypothetical protein ACFY8C_39715 [Streptomyces flavochromogenes]|uniref:DUF4258 domain-containing protein n=1 Tax=Streptomyces flavochromogenes TaxID=68199 RepID=A0ABW6Y3L1_9ACTN|nr:hypothetical protein [Streptomyces flavochromogenes]